MHWVIKLFKLCLFAFNTFYFLIGIGVLIGTAFLYLNPNQINDFIKVEYGNEYLQLVYCLICFATFLILVGFIGCTGILSERNCLLFVYFGLLFGIFCIQFIGAVYLYLKSINYFKGFQNRILSAIKYQYGSSSVHSQAIDYLHYNFKCCGWYSPKDWMDSSYLDPKYMFKTSENVITISPISVYKIPHSCCVNNYDLTCVLMHKYHEVGCEKIVKSYYNQIELYFAWIVAFLNIFQLILLVLSLYLLCMVFFDRKIRNNKFSSSSSDEVGERDSDDDRLYINSYYL